MKRYVIKTITMTKYLTEKGFKIIDTLPNIHKPNFVVWLFEDTDELRKALNNYKK